MAICARFHDLRPGWLGQSAHATKVQWQMLPWLLFFLKSSSMPDLHELLKGSLGALGLKGTLTRLRPVNAHGPTAMGQGKTSNVLRVTPSLQTRGKGKENFPLLKEVTYRLFMIVSRSATKLFSPDQCPSSSYPMSSMVTSATLLANSTHLSRIWGNTGLHTQWPIPLRAAHSPGQGSAKGTWPRLGE
jgi:hypothetical protein